MSASHLLGLQGLQQTPAFIWHSYGTHRALIRQIDTYCSFYTNLFAVLNCFCLTFFLCHRFTNLSLDGGADSPGDYFFNIRANSLRTWAAFPIYHLLGNKLTFFYLSWLTRFSGNWTTGLSEKKKKMSKKSSKKFIKKLFGNKLTCLYLSCLTIFSCNWNTCFSTKKM